MKPHEPPVDPSLPTTVTTSGRVVYDPLRAARPQVDPEAVAHIGKALEEAAAIEDADARGAVPLPLDLAPANDGVLLTEEGQEAARAHVEATVQKGAAPARIDSAPVKIVDPRRAPTTRVEKKSPWAREGDTARDAAAKGLDKDALPSATAPSSRSEPQEAQRPGARARRGGAGGELASGKMGAGGDVAANGAPRGAASGSRRAVWIGLVAAPVVIGGAWLAVRPGAPSGSAGTTGAPAAMTGATAAEPASTGAGTGGSTVPAVSASEATTTSEAPTAAAATAVSTELPEPSSAPPPTVTPPIPASAPPRQKGPDDSYGDAGSSPGGKTGPSAPPNGTQAAPVTSRAPSAPPGTAPVVTAVPAASVAPSAKPVVTGAPSTKPWDVILEKKKETGNQ